MKIGHTSVNPPSSHITLEKADPARPDIGPRAAEGEGAAKVSLSSLSTHLQALETKLADGGHFDSAKVDSIKRAIQAGQFKVNPEAVADKLIASVRELVGR
jgi:negative regulator of flagellin synthesis FlgM